VLIADRGHYRESSLVLRRDPPSVEPALLMEVRQMKPIRSLKREPT
jgi:hypothetical protein